jgi:hypothetical protein
VSLTEAGRQRLKWPRRYLNAGATCFHSVRLTEARPALGQVASKSGFDLPIFRRLAQQRIDPETVCNRARL